MTKKIAVSLPDATLARARRAVAGVAGGKAPNLSNYVARLIDEASASESFAEMVADFLRRSGASAAQIRAAERRVIADFERAGLLEAQKSREATRKVG
ncbi:hypothetical protein BH09MYX1_BH09MYX1_28190 [soil metagenome]